METKKYLVLWQDEYNNLWTVGEGFYDSLGDDDLNLAIESFSSLEETCEWNGEDHDKSLPVRWVWGDRSVDEPTLSEDGTHVLVGGLREYAGTLGPVADMTVGDNGAMVRVLVFE